MRKTILFLLLFFIVAFQSWGAWHGNEVDQYVTVTNSAGMRLPNGDWTVSCLLKLDDNVGTGFQNWWSVGTISTNPSLNFYIGEASATDPLVQNEIKMTLGDDATRVEGSWVTVGDPFTSTNWVRVTYRRSGTTYNYYADGNSLFQTTDANFVAMSSTANLLLFARTGLVSDRFYGGAMAECAQWRRALTVAEITAMSNGVSPDCFMGSITKGTGVFIPMRGDLYLEQVNGTSVTNTGTTVVAHPRTYSCQ